MTTGVIAIRYARALMNLTEREKQSDKAAEVLDALADAVLETPQLANALEDPKVPQSAKKAVVSELAAKAGATPLVNNFVKLLAEKRRLSLLVEIRTAFHELADARAGRAVAQVRSAVALTQAQQDELRERLETLSGKKLTMQVQDDPALLGGLVARIGSTVWDGSLRNQLDQIRQSFIEG